MFKYSIEGIVSFSHAPLSIASWGGMFCTGFSMLAIIVIIIRRIVFGDDVQGWASLICVIVFFGGIQLFSIGIIGQYIGKIYSEVKQRPHYVVDKCSDDKLVKIK